MGGRRGSGAIAAAVVARRVVVRIALDARTRQGMTLYRAAAHTGVPAVRRRARLNRPCQDGADGSSPCRAASTAPLPATSRNRRISRPRPRRARSRSAIQTASICAPARRSQSGPPGQEGSARRTRPPTRSGSSGPGRLLGREPEDRDGLVAGDGSPSSAEPDNGWPQTPPTSGSATTETAGSDTGPTSGAEAGSGPAPSGPDSRESRPSRCPATRRLREGPPRSERERTLTGGLRRDRSRGPGDFAECEQPRRSAGVAIQRPPGGRAGAPRATRTWGLSSPRVAAALRPLARPPPGHPTFPSIPAVRPWRVRPPPARARPALGRGTARRRAAAPRPPRRGCARRPRTGAHQPVGRMRPVGDDSAPARLLVVADAGVPLRQCASSPLPHEHEHGPPMPAVNHRQRRRANCRTPRSRAGGSPPRRPLRNAARARPRAAAPSRRRGSTDSARPSHPRRTWRRHRPSRCRAGARRGRRAGRRAGAAYRRPARARHGAHRREWHAVRFSGIETCQLTVRFPDRLRRSAGRVGGPRRRLHTVLRLSGRFSGIGTCQLTVRFPDRLRRSVGRAV